MIFASKTPRDLNHDPHPWIAFDVFVGRWRRGAEKFQGDAEHKPQAGYDHKQHNEPNPILVDCRTYRGMRLKMNNPKGWRFIAGLVGRAVEARAYKDVIVTTDHIDHALRVLNRLARLEGATDAP